MLSDEEKRFVQYWEEHRNKEKNVFKQWLVGLPLGLAFAIPIFVNYVLGWDKQASYVANTVFDPMVLIVALLLIITFVAIFSKRRKWEMDEQRYLEFKAKENRSTGEAGATENA